MTPQAGQYHLFENGGLVPTADGSVAVVAGSCWGGGGTVNWSVSLQTQGYVRREWAERHGLPLFETAEYQAALDRVCEGMGVVRGEKVPQPKKGEVLLEGARRLGWRAEVAPQNTGGGGHWCGSCHLGCGSGEKQGPAVHWLPKAGRAGARFMEGVAVEEVLWDDGEGGGERRAVGVRGTWTSGNVEAAGEERVTREVVVRAKKVIVAAGTLNSPLVLMRSGLKVRGHGSRRGMMVQETNSKAESPYRPKPPPPPRHLPDRHLRRRNQTLGGRHHHERLHRL